MEDRITQLCKIIEEMANQQGYTLTPLQKAMLAVLWKNPTACVVAKKQAVK